MPRPEVITSRQNQLVVRISKLSDKKYRDKEGLFRFDGVKLFTEAVKSRLKIEYVFAVESKIKELSERLDDCGGQVFCVSDEVLAKLTDEKAPQGIVTVARQFDSHTAADGGDVFDCHRALFLSSIRDPGNLGTIFRSAYAFGIERLFLSSDCADVYSPKTIRAGMGTIFRQPFTVVKDEIEAVKRLQAAGCEVYAAALNSEAEKLGSFALPERLCFAVGNEGHGLSNEFIAACKKTVFIPMQADCESLNAAGAAGILAWEMRLI